MFPVLLLLLLFGLILADELHIYEGEEGDDLTLTWNSPAPMDLSRLHMTCLSTDDRDKMLMYMVGGELKHQAEQFSGRVRCDREALGQGQVRLIVTRLSPLDTGQYECDMAANYDSDRGQWGFITTERFSLLVTPKNLVLIPTAQTDIERRVRPAALMMKKHDPGSASAIIIAVLIAAPCFMVGVMFMMRQFYQ